MAIEGTLRDMSLVDIIQLHCRRAEEARVFLDDEGQTGEIYFADGQVVHAQQGEKTGQAAFYELMKWQDAYFVLEKDLTTPERTIEVPWTGLLMQTLQKIDEERGLEAEASGSLSIDLEDLLQHVSDRVDGIVASAAVDGKGNVLASLVIDEEFREQEALDALSKMIRQTDDTLRAMEAGGFEERITITTRYRFITRPIDEGESYVQVILRENGNIGAARMYLAAYLATREEDDEELI
jgi:hypothetical protein